MQKQFGTQVDNIPCLENHFRLSEQLAVKHKWPQKAEALILFDIQFSYVFQCERNLYKFPYLVVTSLVLQYQNIH